MDIEKRICPGFGELANGSTPYSGEKFDDPVTTARNSDPIYSEDSQSFDEDERSEGTPLGVY